MAPKSQQKMKMKKEDAEREKRIMASKDKVLKTKRDILALIEAMLEPDISKEWFLANCTMLCHADYDDVVQERSIEHLCGYPTCSRPITQPMKQKYHISRVSNKVYDVTERKNFCSNECYKTSKYLKEQLSPIPLYMREEEPRKITLLCDSENSDIAGEEVIFHHTIPKEEIEKVCTVDKKSNAFVSMLNEEIKDCADTLRNLEIKEHVFKKDFVFENKTKEPKGDSCKVGSESSENSELDSEDDRLFPEYDNLDAMADKQMPVRRKDVKSRVISPLKTTVVSSPVQQLSLNLVFDIFKDWMTVDTMKFLLGEKYVYGLKADSLFEKMTTSDPISPERLTSIKNEYINLCLKIDSLPYDDYDNISDTENWNFICSDNKCGVATKNDPEKQLSKTFKKRSKTRKEENNKNVKLSSEVDTAEVNIPSEKTSTIVSSVTGNKTSEFDVLVQVETLSDNDKLFNDKTANVPTSTRKNSSKVGGTAKKKKVSFQEKNVMDDIRAPEESLPASAPSEPGFPLVDSVSQNTLRRQILMGKLKSVYNDLLPLLGLHYTDIRGPVKMFVDTLSLTPTNIMFKPKEWKLISIILLRILTRTVLKSIHKEEQFIKICDNSIIPIKIDIADIENLVCGIMSPENIITLPMNMH